MDFSPTELMILINAVLQRKCELSSACVRAGIQGDKQGVDLIVHDLHDANQLFDRLQAYRQEHK